MAYFLGGDIGSTKTEVMVCDEKGFVRGSGRAGAGNHQVVGYDGMFSALNLAINQALSDAGISIQDITGAGFGISGYDWESDRPNMVRTISRLGITAPFELYNDAIPGLVAGSEEGWGVSVVSGTGCTCWGWDRERRRVGRVTGFGVLMGEAAGSYELVYRAMQLIGYDWSRRGSHTALSQAFVDYAGAKDIEDLIEGYTTYRYRIDGLAAPLIFKVAQAGDTVARQLIEWAGIELGELANAVIRQLEFQDLRFDVILMGSMYEGGAMLIDPMRATIKSCAPGARLVRLTSPPVAGAVLIGMQAAGWQPTPAIRRALPISVQILAS